MNEKSTRDKGSILTTQQQNENISFIQISYIYIICMYNIYIICMYNVHTFNISSQWDLRFLKIDH